MWWEVGSLWCEVSIVQFVCTAIRSSVCVRINVPRQPLWSLPIVHVIQQEIKHNIIQHRNIHGCHLYIYWSHEPDRWLMIIQKNHPKVKDRTFKCFLTMLNAVLQFRFEAVMTRQHTFLLECIKFYSSFWKQSCDETTQACKQIKRISIEKKSI